MKNLLLLFVFFLQVTLSAQNGWTCGTNLRPPLPAPTSKAKNMLSSSDTTTLYIPVTFNILGADNGTGYYTLSKVLDAMCKLQTDYLKYGIYFYLEGDIKHINSSTFYNMSDTYAFSEEMLQFVKDHNTFNTLNIYIVQYAGGYSFMAFHDLDYDNSTYPLTIHDPHSHGIVIPKSFLNSSNHILTHEVGHFLGLWHTFAGWEGHNYPDYAGAVPDTLLYPVYDPVNDTTYNQPWLVERVDGSNCGIASDLICDTRPDYLSIGFQCNANQESDLEQTDPSGAHFRSDGRLYMSYSNDACQDRFSAGESTWMRDVAQGPRNYVLYDQTPPGPFLPTDWALLYPPDGDTIAVSDSITLEWAPAQGADFYLLEFGRKINNMVFVPFVKELLLEGNAYKVGVNTGLNYYWIVRPVHKYYPCVDLRDTSYFTATTMSGSKEIQTQAALHVFPNPVNKRLNWYLPEMAIKSQNTSIQVFDARGLLVRTVYAPEKQSIEVDDLPVGVYLLKLVSGNTVYTGRFVKS